MATPGKKTFCALALFAVLSSLAVVPAFTPSTVVPPKPLREFRGLWIATVGNIDWPSKPGLSTADQKKELLAILDRAVELKLNAVVFQVRPACDAFYVSSLEPWSEYLTGVMGKGPWPHYDPLAFAVKEAHERGLELHAWFNPYRALHKSHQGKVSPGHISKTHPELVRSYGEYLWLDPGERAVQEHSLRVVMDVVRRYDIDGVQFDDYFYPDPKEAKRDFPDEQSWKRFGSGDKDDWRRENVNKFIERVYRSIKAAKPWVKFGISPFGIWRPGNPPQITGSDVYALHYADSRKWLMNGWLDYLSPQLYWTITNREQSFPVLLNWWEEQNVKRRHLWPGISTAYALQYKWPVQEIPNQIQIVRKHPGASGYLFYNTSSLFANTALRDALQRQALAEPALIPPSPWLSTNLPAKPEVSVHGSTNRLKVAWSATGTNAVRCWVVQIKTAGAWSTSIVPADISSQILMAQPQFIAITAVDRLGNSSAPMVLEPAKPLPSKTPPKKPLGRK